MERLSAPAGIEIGLDGKEPAVGPGITIFERAVRPLGAMGQVMANPVPAGSQQIQYWMLNGIVRDPDASRVDPRLCYDFTYLADRPLGWERAKTLGHSHPRPEPGRMGFAEIVEVLHGTVGFMIADILPGPRCTFAALVVGEPGDRVVQPPFLAHASINLAGDPVVFSDVIDRRIVAGELPSDYAHVAEARGLAYFIDLEANARPNLAYRALPPLQRFTAAEWSGVAAATRPLYLDYVEDPGSLDWIVEPELFPKRFPALWARVRDVATRMGEQ